MGAWGFDVTENDETQDRLGDIEYYQIEKKKSLEEALLTVANESVYDEHGIYALASFQLTEGKIHITAKKLALCAIKEELEYGIDTGWSDETKRKKALKNFQKELLKAEVWGEEFALYNAYLKELLEDYVEKNQTTKELIFDEIESSPYFMRKFQDKEEKIWVLDFADIDKDVYISIHLPYERNQKHLVKLFVNHASDTLPDWVSEVVQNVKKTYLLFDQYQK